MNDLFSLSGRIALVTGGSRGIGAAIATEFVRAGAEVIVCARHAAELDETVACLAEYGPSRAVVADLSSRVGIDALVEEVGESTPRLDILVNNAGTTWGAPIDDIPEAGWDKVMNLNVKSMHYLTAGLLPLLRRTATAQEPGRVINIGSIDGINAPVAETYVYAASKAAVHQLTRQQAGRLARDHILVNAIAPGLFASKLSAGLIENEDVMAVARSMIPLRRIGRPEEIGGTAVYLASRAGGYTTGEVLVVDGGQTGAGYGI